TGAGARPGSGRGSGAGTRPASGAASRTPARGSAGAASAYAQPPYQAATLDTRGDLGMPRSTVYISVVMIVVIVVLVAMLLLEMFAQPSATPGRGLRLPAGSLDSGGSSMSGPAQTFDLPGSSAEPGLSSPRGR